MSRFMQLGVGFAGLVLIAVLFSSNAPVQADQHSSHVKDTISVAGLGEVSAEPDQAIVSLNVSALNKNVNTAKAEADRKYSSVVAAAKAQGIARTDVKLSALNLQPEYQWVNNTQVLQGTRVSRSLTITVNDIDKVAPLLQALVEGDVSTINSVQTGFKNTDGMQRKALQAAIADAKEKAAFLAKQFGKELGSAYTITEQNHSTPVFRPFNEGFAMAKSSSAAVPDESFGTQKVTARISVVFHAQ